MIDVVYLVEYETNGGWYRSDIFATYSDALKDADALRAQLERYHCRVLRWDLGFHDEWTSDPFQERVRIVTAEVKVDGQGAPEVPATVLGGGS